MKKSMHLAVCILFSTMLEIYVYFPENTDLSLEIPTLYRHAAVTTKIHFGTKIIYRLILLLSLDFQNQLSLSLLFYKPKLSLNRSKSLEIRFNRVIL